MQEIFCQRNYFNFFFSAKIKYSPFQVFFNTRRPASSCAVIAFFSFPLSHYLLSALKWQVWERQIFTLNIKQCQKTDELFNWRGETTLFIFLSLPQRDSKCFIFIRKLNSGLQAPLLCAGEHCVPSLPSVHPMLLRCSHLSTCPLSSARR